MTTAPQWVNNTLTIVNLIVNAFPEGKVRVKPLPSTMNPKIRQFELWADGIRLHKYQVSNDQLILIQFPEVIANQIIKAWKENENTTNETKS